MHWIRIRRPDQIAYRSESPKILELKPMGVAFHGNVTDVLWREGKIDCALDTLARIRDAGVLAGVSTQFSLQEGNASIANRWEKRLSLSLVTSSLQML